MYRARIWSKSIKFLISYLVICSTFLVTHSTSFALSSRSGSNRISYVSVAVGGNFVCGITTIGGVACAGPNEQGQLNVPSSVRDDAVVESGIRVTKISLGGDYWGRGVLKNNYGCALRENHTLVCWGRMLDEPIVAPGFTDVIDVQTGGGRACLLRSSGQIYCWHTVTSNSDSAIPQYPAGQYRLLSVVYNTDMCAVNIDNQIVCVGYGDHPYNQNIPTFAKQITYVGSGRYGECAIDIDGLMKCWSQSRFPSSSEGNISYINGESTECRLNSSRSVQCLAYGGDGYPASNWAVPEGLASINQIAIGSTMICALDESGHSVCWGPMPASLPSFSSLAGAVPQPPIINIRPLDQKLELKWLRPENVVAGVVVTYEAILLGEGKSFSCLTFSRSCLIPGLKNGHIYTGFVRATTVDGTSEFSDSMDAFPTNKLEFSVVFTNRVAPSGVEHQWLVANAIPGEKVTFVAYPDTFSDQVKYCHANLAGQCWLTETQQAAGAYSIFAHFTKSNGTEIYSKTARINIAQIGKLQSSARVGETLRVRIIGGVPRSQLVVTTDRGRVFRSTVSPSGAGAVSVRCDRSGTSNLFVVNDGVELGVKTVTVRK